MRTICTLLVLGLLTMAVPATSHADDAPATKVSFEFENQDVVKVIQVLAKFGKANVIVSPQVKGTISINLKDVPWKYALKVVVRTVGAELIEEDFGIFRVVPATDVAKSKVTKKMHAGSDTTAELEARQKLERLLVDSKKRADELRAKLEKERGRFPRIAREKAEALAKMRAAEAALKAAQKRVEPRPWGRFRLGTDLIMEDDGKGGQALKVRLKRGPGVQSLQVYDVRDLETLNGKPIDIAKIIRGVMKDDGDLEAKPGILIVRGSSEVQGRVTRVLDKLRSAQQPNAVIGLGGGAGIKPFPRVKKKDGGRSFKGFVFGKKAVEAAKAQKKAAQPYVISLGTSDRVVVHRKAKSDHAAKRKAVAYLSAGPLAAARKRIENLQRAAGYLRAAGDSAGAKRVAAQVAEAMAQLEQQEAIARSGGPPAVLRGSIDGLRREVHALRGEVRELTALVRRLLQQQRK